jgi:hypothetical protein
MTLAIGTPVTHRLPSTELLEMARGFAWQPRQELIDRNDPDFLARFHWAEALKIAMRWAYVRQCQQAGLEPFEQGVKRAREFWAEYESINRHFLPDDPVYYASQSGITPTVGNSYLAIKPTATGQGRVLESYLGGEATTSTVFRTEVSRATTPGVTPVALTPQPANDLSPAAAFTVSKSFTTQPTGLTFGPVQAFNAFGGVDRWVPQPGEELYVQSNARELNWMARAGTPVFSSFSAYEEL